VGERFNTKNKLYMSKQLSPNKEIVKIVRKAQKQGWRVEKASSSHILFYPPNIEDGIVTMSSSPSSFRNHKNILSLLKAKGLKL
jgi:hypothetical protein